MPVPDYYSILQVHPEAEGIVIEAAYKRLAREYHPDVSKAPNAHERMVLLNEAFEVLSDAQKRREYDQERESSSREPGFRLRAEKTATAPKAEKEYARRATETAAPIAPNPLQFGIKSDYFTIAVEGSRAWKKRRAVMPISVLIILRTVAWITGIGPLLLNERLRGTSLGIVPPATWLLIPVALECLLAAVASKYDARLLKEEFDPEYNPNPEAYARFSEALAKFEAEFATVYVARTGYRFHMYRFCGNMVDPAEIPKYVATAKGYTACSRCGYTRISPQLLPPPFGKGPDVPLKNPYVDDQKVGAHFRYGLWIASAIATLTLSGAMFWIISRSTNRSEALKPPHGSKSADPSSPEMEDMDKLTPDQLDNLKAERDFTP